MELKHRVIFPQYAGGKEGIEIEEGATLQEHARRLGIHIPQGAWSEWRRGCRWEQGAHSGSIECCWWSFRRGDSDVWHRGHRGSDQEYTDKEWKGGV